MNVLDQANQNQEALQHTNAFITYKWYVFINTIYK